MTQITLTASPRTSTERAAALLKHVADAKLQIKRFGERVAADWQALQSYDGEKARENAALLHLLGSTTNSFTGELWERADEAHRSAYLNDTRERFATMLVNAAQHSNRDTHEMHALATVVRLLA